MKQTSLDLNGPFLAFQAQPQSTSVLSNGAYTGNISPLIQVTYNGYPVRGYLYYPTSSNLGQSLDVIVLYHGTITDQGVSPADAASTFLSIALNRINLKDKLIFSVAYPQDAIPLWEANPSLPAQQFPGLNYPTFYLGDNIVYAEAALLWVKNSLNSFLSSNGISKTINRVYTFGHSQGAYLVHRLNTMQTVDGVISNAPGPIDLLDRCSGVQNTINITCNKIRVGIGSTLASPSAYNTRSLKSYLSGTLSPTLFTQALDDDSYQVNLMQNTVQVGLSTCTNCATSTFNYYSSGGHDAFVTNTYLQQDIRTFVGSKTAGIATFTGICTAYFVGQNPTNIFSSNTGIVTHRWYAVGYGALRDGSFLGSTIIGSATTTLTLTNLTSPNASGLQFYVAADYIPSAYQTSSPVTAGTARSTGNAVNEILTSNIVTLTVSPLISFTTQPSSQTAAQTITKTFTVEGSATDGGSVSYQWNINGNVVSDGVNSIGGANFTVSGATTSTLSVSCDTIGTYNVTSTITYSTASNSPRTSNAAVFTVVAARKIINVETVNQTGQTTASLSSTNIFNQDITLSEPSGARQGTIYSFYAPETDVEVFMDLYAGSGLDNGGYRGGQGGTSTIRLTLRKDVEYVLSAFTQASGGSGIFLWRKASLIACCGGGGNAGNGGNGGDGGGVNVAGAPGSGRGGGNGGVLFSAGTIPTTSGIFGSLAGQGTVFPGDSRAPAPLGGRVLGCTKGGSPPGSPSYWLNRGYSPCQDVGITQLVSSDGLIISNTASINRGHKVGYACRQTAGAGQNGGGNGANGATGGDGGTNGGGGGGGGGYTDGSITVISTRQGGNTGAPRVVIRNAI